MSMTQDQIFVEAMSLNEKDRAALADRLWRSIDGLTRAEIDAAWADEAERRIDAIDRGKARLIPGEQAMEEVRRKLGGK